MDGFDGLRMVGLVLMLVILFCCAIFMVTAVVVFFKMAIEDYLWERNYRKQRFTQDPDQYLTYFSIRDNFKRPYEEEQRVPTKRKV